MYLSNILGRFDPKDSYFLTLRKKQAPFNEAFPADIFFLCCARTRSAWPFFVPFVCAAGRGRPESIRPHTCGGRRGEHGRSSPSRTRKRKEGGRGKRGETQQSVVVVDRRGEIPKDHQRSGQFPTECLKKISRFLGSVHCGASAQSGCFVKHF